MQNKFSLEGKVIVVTGGTGIIGNSFIKGITQAGGAVGILGRNEQVARERADKVISEGGRAIALVADVLDEKSLESAKNEVLSKFGKIDGLVNAAGGNMPEAVVQKDHSFARQCRCRCNRAVLVRQRQLRRRQRAGCRPALRAGQRARNFV